MGSAQVIDVGPTLHAGRPTSLDETVEVPAFDSFRFPDPAAVRLDLRRVDRGLQIDGAIEVRVTGDCDRCLEAVTLPLRIDVEERFDPPSGTSDPFGENNVLSGTSLDVGDLIRQLVVSALPLGLWCREDCRGLCAACGRSKNVGGGCDCPEMEGDHGESEMENPALEDA